MSAAEHEDQTIFASSRVTGGPINLLGVPNISTLNVGNSANGGNLAYSDLLATMAKAASVRARPPFTWFMSPRTFYSRIMGLVDLQSRPIFIPTATEGLYNAPPTSFYVGRILGWPAYITPFISETEALGSGTNLSHLFFTNSSYLHLAQDSYLAIAVSTEFLFSSNSTALRATQHEDFSAAPPQGCVALLGIA